MIPTQIACTKMQRATKKFSALVAESFDDILPLPQENIRSGVRSVIYKVLEQVLLELLRRDMIDETHNRHIFSNFKGCNAADKVCGKLLSTNSCIAPTVAFNQYRTGEEMTT